MSELLDVKKDFPVLVNNKDLVYLDTGATALKPQSVIDKINEYYTLYGVNAVSYTHLTLPTKRIV